MAKLTAETCWASLYRAGQWRKVHILNNYFVWCGCTNDSLKWKIKWWRINDILWLWELFCIDCLPMLHGITLWGWPMKPSLFWTECELKMYKNMPSLRYTVGVVNWAFKGYGVSDMLGHLYKSWKCWNCPLYFIDSNESLYFYKKLWILNNKLFVMPSHFHHMSTNVFFASTFSSCVKIKNDFIF